MNFKWKNDGKTRIDIGLSISDHPEMYVNRVKNDCQSDRKSNVTGGGVQRRARSTKVEKGVSRDNETG